MVWFMVSRNKSAALKVTSKNTLRGIFRDGNGKMRFSVSFIFKHLRA